MNKVTILVIDDDEASQAALRQMLDSEGWSVHIAANASLVLPALAKRYSAYTQAYLGLAMAVAPVGGWIAAGGREGPEPWLLGLAIGLWVGGFDILYACQDVEVDRRQGLRSIPTRFGVGPAIRLSRTSRCLCFSSAVSSRA